MNSLERFRAACRFDPVDRPPVWMMRQAGRTLPEYRALKEKYTFWQLAQTPELAAEVTLQPVRRFPVDAAINFSDILTVPAAMGLNIDFTPAPVISPVVTSRADVDALKIPDVATSLDYVAGALRAVIGEIGEEKAVLGFSGAPFTLACYMVDGLGAKGFVKTRAMMYRDPALFTALLDKIGEVVADYVQMQVEAGITAYQLFDTWVGDLPKEQFRRFALPAVARVFERLSGKGAPGIYYINGIGNLLEDAAQCGSDALGIDWRLSLAEVRQRTGPDTVVQGNLDPVALFGKPEEIRQKVFDMIDQTGGRGHVANLGHGLSPDTPIEGIAAFVDAVVEWRAQ